MLPRPDGAAANATAAAPGAGAEETDGTAAETDGTAAGGGRPSVEDALPRPVEVTFAAGSDTPTGDTDALLGPVVQALLADPGTRVRVVGHAAASNDPVLEEQLSRSRAETVADLLADRGVPAGRADVSGAGAAEAGASMSGTDRRVTVEVVRG